jgi:hypothetical protein
MALAALALALAGTLVTRIFLDLSVTKRRAIKLHVTTKRRMHMRPKCECKRENPVRDMGSQRAKNGVHRVCTQ